MPLSMLLPVARGGEGQTAIRPSDHTLPYLYGHVSREGDEHEVVDNDVLLEIHRSTILHELWSDEDEREI